MTKFEQARINAGLSITKLSKESDVSRSTIEKMERGEAVRAELAARACKVISQHLGNEVTYQSLECVVRRTSRLRKEPNASRRDE